MKTKINPLVGLAIVVVAVVLILALMYRHSFRPQEGSMESMSPAERAKVYRALAPPKPGPGGPSTQAPPQGNR